MGGDSSEGEREGFQKEKEGSGRMTGCRTHYAEELVPESIEMAEQGELVEPREEAIYVL